MEQQRLPLFQRNKETFLKNYFKNIFKKPIILTLTENSNSMISFREKQDTISVRLHHIFLNANDEVLEEIVRFMAQKDGKTPAIRAFIRMSRNFLEASPSRTITINPKGKIYNLRDIFKSLNREYFDDSVSSAITWGKKRPRYAVREKTLGTYQKKTNTIRINQSLDRKIIPRYFIEYIVYHEMLHSVIDTVVKNGRRVIHSKEFKKREREYKNYHKAIEWEKRIFRI